MSFPPFNPLTAALICMAVSVPASLWAKGQLRQRTRSALAAAYYFAQLLISLWLGLWSASLGGFWWAGAAFLAIIAMAECQHIRAVVEGDVPTWAAKR